MKTDFSNTFNKFKTLNVIVIGDIMIDSYLWGNVSRISPEAPIPIVNTTKRELRMGGAANVALNIKSLSANPILCTVIGNDSHGFDFMQLMNDDNMITEGIISDNSRLTTIKHRVISSGQHLLRIDEEVSTPLSQQLSEALLQKVKEIVSKYEIHALIFEDYDKGVVTQHLIENVVTLAKSQNIPILVDPKKRNFLNYKNVDVFKPNFKELCDGVGVSLNKTDFKGLFEAEKKLRQTLNHKYSFVTLSEYGIFLSNGESFNHFPSMIREVTDVSGAGDTVIATVSLCIAAGLDIVTACKIANVAGGLVCERVGVVPVDFNALLKTLNNMDF